MYRVTKHFTRGLLAGLTITEQTSIRYDVGIEYQACAGSSSYVVTACEPV